MRLGIATDHGGFGLKQELIVLLRSAGHEVVDFGAHDVNQSDDYPDYVTPPTPLPQIATPRSTRPAGVRAALIHDHFSAKQGVEDASKLRS